MATSAVAAALGGVAAAPAAIAAKFAGASGAGATAGGMGGSAGEAQHARAEPAPEAGAAMAMAPSHRRECWQQAMARVPVAAHASSGAIAPSNNATHTKLASRRI